MIQFMIIKIKHIYIDVVVGSHNHTTEGERARELARPHMLTYKNIRTHGDRDRTHAFIHLITHTHTHTQRERERVRERRHLPWYLI